MGIMNGTTNFMLCKMEDDGTVMSYNRYICILIHVYSTFIHSFIHFWIWYKGADYGDVLKEAQALGFAEADPTADVEGYDVQAKISILGKDLIVEIFYLQ